MKGFLRLVVERFSKFDSKHSQSYSSALCNLIFENALVTRSYFSNLIDIFNYEDILIRCTAKLHHT